VIGADPAIPVRPGLRDKGAMMGCSNPHPHGQVCGDELRLRWGRPASSRRSERTSSGTAANLVGDYLAKELAARERIVCRNDQWVALVPYWAVWPFELMLVPVRCVPDLPSLAGAERDALADILRRVSVRYDNLFPHLLPLLDGLPRAPADGGAPRWRLHAAYSLRCCARPRVRKFSGRLRVGRRACS